MRYRVAGAWFGEREHAEYHVRYHAPGAEIVAVKDESVEMPLGEPATEPPVQPAADPSRAEPRQRTSTGRIPRKRVAWMDDG